MSTHAQIDIRKGDTVVRIHTRYGDPREILGTLRKVSTTGRTTPQAIAKNFISRWSEDTFNIITEDFQRDALTYYYTMDVSVAPWKVVQETCPVHKIIHNGDGTGFVSPTLTPSRFRTIVIKAKAAAAGR